MYGVTEKNGAKFKVYHLRNMAAKHGEAVAQWQSTHLGSQVPSLVSPGRTWGEILSETQKGAGLDRPD